MPVYIPSQHVHVGPTWVKNGLHGYQLGKLCGPHMVLEIWAPHGLPMWADHMGPTRNLCKLSGHRQETSNIIWDPNRFSNVPQTEHPCEQAIQAQCSMWSKWAWAVTG